MKQVTSKSYTNTLGHPIGFPLPEWTPRSLPPRTTIPGRYCHIELLNPEKHGDALYAADMMDPDGANWTYLFQDLPTDRSAYQEYLQTIAASNDPLFHAIVDARTGEAVGMAALMRIDVKNGAIEVGNIRYSPRLQRTPAATEAMFLLMKRVFDELGYRRYEWKCDSLNAPSKSAARRLGFVYEGKFRQAGVYKQRNRDTSWFAMIDSEWPALKAAYGAWLSPDNFTPDGQQKQRLADLIAAEKSKLGPS